jgi:acyl-CoA synthetase (AMP-forming)/AMP-acid ligase II
VVIVEDFPRSTAGKTLKRVLRDQYATQTPAPAAIAMMPS